MMTKTLLKSVLTINASLAIIWIYQGLVPKIIYRVIEEQIFWRALGVEEFLVFTLIQLSGIVEIIFGGLFIFFIKSRAMHYLNILAMIFFCMIVFILYPHHYGSAFNPFVMNFTMAMLSVVALQLLPTIKTHSKTE